jgi:hypothetical protein
MQEVLMKVGIALAIAAIASRFIPKQLDLAVAVSRHLHIGLPLRLLIPTLLLIAAAGTSAIALGLAILRLTAPLRT